MTASRFSPIIALMKRNEFIHSHGRERRLYVLVVDRFAEPYLLRRILEDLKSRFSRGSSLELSVVTYDGKEADPRDILDDLRTQSFFSDRRLVIVEEADKFVEEHFNAIAQFVESPSTGNVLTLVVERLNKNSSFRKLAIRHGEVFSPRTPQTPEILSWVEREVRSRKKQIAPRAIEGILERTGENLSLLEMEIEKLCIYVGEKPLIEEEDVQNLIGRNIEFDVYALIDALLNGNGERAFEALEQIFTQAKKKEDVAVEIVGRMAKHLRKLEDALRDLRRGVSEEEVVKGTGLPLRSHEKFRRQLSQVDEELLGQLRKMLLEADLAVKMGQMKGELAFEVLVGRFLEEGIHSARKR